MEIKEITNRPKLVPFDELKEGVLFKISSSTPSSDVYIKTFEVKCEGLNVPLNFMSLERGVIARLEPNVNVVPYSSKLMIQVIQSDITIQESETRKC